MIAAELDLLEAAMKSGEYDYLHLLSGQDLPLKTADEIHEWFDIHQGENYIDMDMNPEHQQNAVDRISKYWIFQDCIGRNTGMVAQFLRKAEALCSKIQKVLKIDRTRKIPMKIHKGAQWFSITEEMAQELLTYRKKIKKWFRMGLCADELFVQTIACNSPLKDTIVNDSLRIIDWERGKPYTYTKEDEKLLLNSEGLFARKFCTEVDKEIVDIVYKRVKNRWEKAQYM